MTTAADVVRRVLLVAAAVCLLGAGGLDLARPAAAAAGLATAAPAGPERSPQRLVPSRAAAESAAPSGALVLRAALSAATPVVGAGELAPPRPAAGPTAGGALQPAARPLPQPHVRAPGGGPTDRAPPRPAGT